MKSYSTSEHHLIPRHGVTLFGKNSQENIVRINDKTHRNFHHVFQNREPHAQIRYLLNFNRKVLQGHFINEVEQIISDDPSYIYRNGLYVPRELNNI